MPTGAVRQVRCRPAATSIRRSPSGTTARLALHARFDPPGIAFIIVGGVSLFFTDGVPAGTVYLDMDGLETSPHGDDCRRAVHGDAGAGPCRPDGQFGPAGEDEWMAFLKDPAGNTIGLVERKPAANLPQTGGVPFSASTAPAR